MPLILLPRPPKPPFRDLPARSFTAIEFVPPTGVTSHGGLHHIMQGMGDPGVAVVPQTLHTIEVGVAA